MIVAMATAFEEARVKWLRSLPSTIARVTTRWSLTVGSPFRAIDKGCAWVAPATDATGKVAVLKVSFPHFEGEHEIQGLRFWDGEPTVRLLAADDELHVMLLERCVPGTSLREIPEAEQDVVIAGLLRRMWRRPPASHPFRSLETMLAHWSAEAECGVAHADDPGLVREGIELLNSLPRAATQGALLATDLHAGNVLRSGRAPWLVIDPKPFLGDPAYDATQHLLNCKERLLARPDQTIKKFAELLEVSAERVGLWTFARAAVATVAVDGLQEDWSMQLARSLKATISPLK
jgi:streptomycin 6-kinase